MLQIFSYTVTISIHAPAQGATAWQWRSVWRRQISIHAPAQGATEYLSAVLRGCKISIHAPAQGATQTESTIHKTENDFNSRSRTGSDSDFIASFIAKMISIHAPAQGATMSVFIH